MRKLFVNQPYISKVNELYPAHTGISLFYNNLEMSFDVENPSLGEIDAIQNGKGRYWLIYHKGVIIIQFRFESLEENEVFQGHYNFHISDHNFSEVSYILKEEEVGDEYLFHFVLVEQGTGIVRAIRASKIRPIFLKKFKKCILRQIVSCPEYPENFYRYDELTSELSRTKLQAKAICSFNAGPILKGEP